jgi:hypothetical protein
MYYYKKTQDIFFFKNHQRFKCIDENLLNIFNDVTCTWQLDSVSQKAICGEAVAK